MSTPNTASLLELNDHIDNIGDLVNRIELAMKDKDAQIAKLQKQLREELPPPAESEEKLRELVRLVWRRGESVYDKRCQQLVEELMEMDAI